LGGLLKIGYKDIISAKETLNLPDQASMDEIKASYRRLINQWHPDKCQEDKKICEEMTRNLIAAYDMIVLYCNRYKYSFTQEDIQNNLFDENWWVDRFGDDPIWGNVNNS
jgi:DnaJ-class molecular chaperone